MFVILSRLKKKGKYSLVFFLWICYDSYEKKDKTFKTKVREPMQMDLTRGGITRPMLLFAGPMIAGNLLQQCYNIADTLIVGRALGASALASVGFSFTLMTFLTSVLLGVCFTFLYNYFACLLCSVGNSVAPMAFLAVSTVLNIGLDLWFVLGLSLIHISEPTRPY